eukprot:scaffold391696_cov31-Prasinocladus_malaysianus.AAC.1
MDGLSKPNVIIIQASMGQLCNCKLDRTAATFAQQGFVKTMHVERDHEEAHEETSRLAGILSN